MESSCVYVHVRALEFVCYIRLYISLYAGIAVYVLPYYRNKVNTLAYLYASRLCLEICTSTELNASYLLKM